MSDQPPRAEDPEQTTTGDNLLLLPEGHRLRPVEFRAGVEALSGCSCEETGRRIR